MHGWHKLDKPFDKRVVRLFLAGRHHAGDAPPDCIRVEQADWVRPLRGDWMIQLEEAVLNAAAPVELVAHGLGCVLVAAWASHSQNIHRIRHAALHEPDDTEREDRRSVLKSWSPISLQRLPFPSVLHSSSHNSYCTAERAQFLAYSWGSVFHGN